MQTKKILIDVDGVIADFISYYLKEMNNKLNASFKYEDVMLWDFEEALCLDKYERNISKQILTTPGLANSLEAFPDVVDTILLLDSIADVYFLTSPLKISPTWVYDRSEWLCKIFGHELGSKVIHTKHKHLIPGDLFIDDNFENIVEWDKHNNGLACLWTCPWNEEYKWKMRLDRKSFALLGEELADWF